MEMLHHILRKVCCFRPPQQKYTLTLDPLATKRQSLLKKHVPCCGAIIKRRSVSSSAPIIRQGAWSRQTSSATKMTITKRSLHAISDIKPPNIVTWDVTRKFTVQYMKGTRDHQFKISWPRKRLCGRDKARPIPRIYDWPWALTGSNN